MIRSWRRVRRATPVDLSAKTFVVTGASPGSLGEATARTLATWGAAVIVTTRSRTDEALAAIRDGLEHPARVTAHPLDLASATSVERFADWCHGASGGRLDALVNNAGIHLDLLSKWTAPRLTDDGREIHFRTNYLGTAHLTDRLLPLLLGTARRVGEARVVHVASHLHHRGTNAGLFAPIEPYDSWVAYGVSKLALVHHAFELERRHGAEGLHATCLHPGAVFTKIADKGLDEAGVLGRVRAAFAPIEAAMLLTPEEGAQTQIACATAPGIVGGRYYRDLREAEPNRDALDEAVSRRLWESTANWLSTMPSTESRLT